MYIILNTRNHSRLVLFTGSRTSPEKFVLKFAYTSTVHAHVHFKDTY